MIEGTYSATMSGFFDNIHIDWKLILEFIRVTIWPFIIFFFIFYFRKNIAALVDRIREFEGFGAKVRVDKQLEAQKEFDSEEKIAKSEVAKQKKLIGFIKEDYEKKLGEKKKTIEYLINEVSVRNLHLDFERIYNLIFGSQINLLKTLSAKGSVGSTQEEVIRFFVMVQRAWLGFQSWTFNQYLNYLLIKQLIEITPQGNYIITDKGRAFLSYISYLGYTENKPL